MSDSVERPYEEGLLLKGTFNVMPNSTCSLSDSLWTVPITLEKIYSCYKKKHFLYNTDLSIVVALSAMVTKLKRPAFMKS